MEQRTDGEQAVNVETDIWNAAIEAAALRLHWLWNADGTKCERRVSDKSAASIRLLKKSPPPVSP